MAALRKNSNWEDLPIPSIGDIVHLHYEDVFSKLLKIKVIGIENSAYTGLVEAIFELKTSTPVVVCEDLRVGQPVNFGRELIHHVIQKA